jgi:hypothetical protein
VETVVSWSDDSSSGNSDRNILEIRSGSASAIKTRSFLPWIAGLVGAND